MRYFVTVYCVMTLLISGFANAAVSTTAIAILSAATATGAGDAFQPWGPHRTFDVRGTTSAGAGAATVLIEGANSTSSVSGDWVLLCTLSLTLATTSSGDGCATNATWKYVRARVSAISGTDASVTVRMGTEAGR